MNNVNLDKTNIVGFPERNMKNPFLWKVFLFPAVVIGPAIVFPLFETPNYHLGSDIVKTVFLLIYAGIGVYFWNRSVNHNSNLIMQYAVEVSNYVKNHYGITVIGSPVWGRRIAILDGGVHDATASDGTKIRVKYRISDDKTEIEVLNEHDKQLPKLY